MRIKKIIRSNRKTIALQVDSDTALIVKAPFNASDAIIEKVILKHYQWLVRKQKEILLRQTRFPKKKFVEGECFYFLGNKYNLRLVKEQKEVLTIKNHSFLLRKNHTNPREIFINWYKRMAQIKLPRSVARLAEQYGFSYNKISITNAEKQWGSCSHLGNLNFPWRLIMTPQQIIDYVIIHELVHLNIKNHSKIFWSKVKEYLPEYKMHRDWLKKNGHLSIF